MTGGITFSGSGSDERSISWGIGYNISLFGNASLWGVYDNTNSKFVYRYQQATGTFIISGKVAIETSDPPASPTAAGRAGQITWDTNYFYLCVGTNTWKRVPLSAW